jgi:ubiquinone/menaquinone biosynthesis C-methylase UbiE
MMATADVYRITDKLDDSTLDALISRLEARGKHPRFIAMMQEYFDAMNIDAAATVLDVGCGTGVASRAIAGRKGFAGRVTGIDRSPYLVAVGTKRVAEEGLAARVDLRAGDSHSLDIPDAAFDAVVAHTLLSHVEDQLGVLRELARIVKPGGKIGIFDGDYASLTYGGDDPATPTAIPMDDLIIDALVTNPRIMREMPQLLREVGLTLVASFAYVIADIGKADFFEPGLQSMARLLPKSGAMSEADARAWVAAMMKRSEEGTFFGATNFYSYVAVRR